MSSIESEEDVTNFSSDTSEQTSESEEEATTSSSRDSTNVSPMQHLKEHINKGQARKCISTELLQSLTIKNSIPKLLHYTNHYMSKQSEPIDLSKKTNEKDNKLDFKGNLFGDSADWKENKHLAQNYPYLQKNELSNLEQTLSSLLGDSNNEILWTQITKSLKLGENQFPNSNETGTETEETEKLFSDFITKLILTHIPNTQIDETLRKNTLTYCNDTISDQHQKSLPVILNFLKFLESTPSPSDTTKSVQKIGYNFKNYQHILKNASTSEFKQQNQNSISNENLFRYETPREDWNENEKSFVENKCYPTTPTTLLSSVSKDFCCPCQNSQKIFKFVPTTMVMPDHVHIHPLNIKKTIQKVMQNESITSHVVTNLNQMRSNNEYPGSNSSTHFMHTHNAVPMKHTVQSEFIHLFPSKVINDEGYDNQLNVHSSCSTMIMNDVSEQNCYNSLTKMNKNITFSDVFKDVHCLPLSTNNQTDYKIFPENMKNEKMKNFDCNGKESDKNSSVILSLNSNVSIHNSIIDPATNIQYPQICQLNDADKTQDFYISKTDLSEYPIDSCSQTRSGSFNISSTEERSATKSKQNNMTEVSNQVTNEINEYCPENNKQLNPETSLNKSLSSKSVQVNTFEGNNTKIVNKAISSKDSSENCFLTAVEKLAVNDVKKEHTNVLLPEKNVLNVDDDTTKQAIKKENFSFLNDCSTLQFEKTTADISLDAEKLKLNETKKKVKYVSNDINDASKRLNSKISASGDKSNNLNTSSDASSLTCDRLRDNTGSSHKECIQPTINSQQCKMDYKNQHDKLLKFRKQFKRKLKRTRKYICCKKRLEISLDKLTNSLLLDKTKCNFPHRSKVVQSNQKHLEALKKTRPLANSQKKTKVNAIHKNPQNKTCCINSTQSEGETVMKFKHLNNHLKLVSDESTFFDQENLLKMRHLELQNNSNELNRLALTSENNKKGDYSYSSLNSQDASDLLITAALSPSPAKLKTHFISPETFPNCLKRSQEIILNDTYTNLIRKDSIMANIIKPVLKETSSPANDFHTCYDITRKASRLNHNNFEINNKESTLANYINPVLNKTIQYNLSNVIDETIRKSSYANLKTLEKNENTVWEKNMYKTNPLNTLTSTNKSTLHFIGENKITPKKIKQLEFEKNCLDPFDSESSFDKSSYFPITKALNNLNKLPFDDKCRVKSPSPRLPFTNKRGQLSPEATFESGVSLDKIIPLSQNIPCSSTGKSSSESLKTFIRNCGKKMLQHRKSLVVSKHISGATESEKQIFSSTVHSVEFKKPPTKYIQLITNPKFAGLKNKNKSCRNTKHVFRDKTKKVLYTVANYKSCFSKILNNSYSVDTKMHETKVKRFFFKSDKNASPTKENTDNFFFCFRPLKETCHLDKEDLWNGQTILMRAVFNKSYELIETILFNGCTIDQIDFKGRTAFTICAHLVDVKTAQMLLKHGSIVNDYKALQIAFIRSTSTQICEFIKLILMVIHSGINLTKNTSWWEYTITNVIKNRSNRHKTGKQWLDYLNNIIYLCHQPQSLRMKCILTIRNHLLRLNNGRSIIELLFYLPLPKYIVDMLTYKELGFYTSLEL